MKFLRLSLSMHKKIISFTPWSTEISILAKLVLKGIGVDELSRRFMNMRGLLILCVCLFSAVSSSMQFLLAGRGLPENKLSSEQSTRSLKFALKNRNILLLMGVLKSESVEAKSERHEEFSSCGFDGNDLEDAFEFLTIYLTVVSDEFIINAVRRKDVYCAAVALKYGASVNAINPTTNENLLAMAINNADKAMAFTLLQHPSIDVNARSNGMSAPIVLAFHKNLSEVFRHLSSRDDLDINARDFFGFCVLHYILMWGSYEALEIILERDDVDIFVKDGQHKAPLAYLSPQYHSSTIKRLVDYYQSKQHGVRTN